MTKKWIGKCFAFGLVAVVAFGVAAPAVLGAIAIDATFTTGAEPDDFLLLGAGGVDPTATSGAGTWDVGLAAGQTSVWIDQTGAATATAVGPVIHGFAEITVGASSGTNNDDRTVVYWDDTPTDVGFALYFQDGAVQLNDVGGSLYAAVAVANLDAAKHSYGWELDIPAKTVKLFFDGLPIGLPSYSVSGDGASDFLYLGDASGGGSHDEVWDRFVVAEGAFPAIPTGVPGDFNGDGNVTTADYDILRANWLTTGNALNVNGELTGPLGFSDGIVDLYDFREFKDNLFVGPASALASSIPEPSALVLLLAAAPAWFVLRSRGGKILR